MDHSQLSSLKRSQLQQLARRESLKANMKNAEIIRLLFEKYPDGVPELSDEPSAAKPSTSSPSKAKRPSRRSKRKSTTKSGLPSVKAEEVNPNLHVEPALDKFDVPHKGRDVRSMAPPPVTPSGSFRLPTYVWLPSTPPIDAIFEPEAGDEIGGELDAHDTGCQSETTPTLPEATAATSHQVHDMLRSLTDIIDAASFDPEEPSSIICRAKALNAILDTTIIPRMMKVDKDVKDMVWMRAAVGKHLGPRFKEKDISSEPRNSGGSDATSFPGPRLPPPKRAREEEGEQGSSQPCISKRTRVQ